MFGLTDLFSQNATLDGAFGYLTAGVYLLKTTKL
ncbi:MAG: hypothetical protein ACI9G9_001422 [Psychromonas sp.]|jgi:hypothetical protein